MLLIKEIPSKERPRERFMRYGKEALSNQELIAILLRTGTNQTSVLSLAHQIMRTHTSMRKISQTSVNELTKITGMGQAKAIQLLSALELGKRLFEESFGNEPLLTDPEKVYDWMRPRLESSTQEEFHALYLNTKGRLITSKKLFVGSLSSAIVHPRELFKYAVSVSAANVILVHNHPSGDPEPSKSDDTMTMTMIQNGDMMDIPILDHIVVGQGVYFSYREQGKM